MDLIDLQRKLSVIWMDSYREGQRGARSVREQYEEDSREATSELSNSLRRLERLTGRKFEDGRECE